MNIYTESINRTVPENNKILPQKTKDVTAETNQLVDTSELAAEEVRNILQRKEKRIIDEAKYNLKLLMERCKNGTLDVDKASNDKALAARQAFDDKVTAEALRACKEAGGDFAEKEDKEKASAAVEAAIEELYKPFKQAAAEAGNQWRNKFAAEMDVINRAAFQYHTLKVQEALQTDVKSEAATKTSSELKDLGQLIIDAINGIQDGYMEVFLQATEKMTKFFEAFEALRSQLHTYLGEIKDNKQKFYFEKLMGDFQDLLEKFNTKDAQLFPMEKDGVYGTTTKEIAENWIAQLGLSENCLKEDPAGSGKYRVMMDFTPVDNIIDSLSKFYNNGYDHDWLDPAKYGAWESGFNAQVAQLRSSIEILMQKSNNANSGVNRNYEILKKFFDDQLAIALQILRAT